MTRQHEQKRLTTYIAHEGFMTSVDHHGTGCSEVLAAHLAEKRFLTGVHLLVPPQATATDRRKPCHTHRTERVKVLLQVKTKGKSSCTHHTRRVFGQCGSSCVSTYTSYYWSRNKPWLKCCFTSTEIVGLLGTRGRGYGGGGRRRLYTCRYTVTTRMTTALRWAAMRAILMFQ